MNKIKLHPLDRWGDGHNNCRIMIDRGERGHLYTRVYGGSATTPHATKQTIGWIYAAEIDGEHIAAIVDLPAPENPVYWGDVVEWDGAYCEHIVVGKDASRELLLLQVRGSIGVFSVCHKRVTYNGRPVTEYRHGERPEVQA